MRTLAQKPEVGDGMNPEPLTKRLEIRKKIQKVGEKLYESVEDTDLKWLTGEIMALNEDYVLTHPDTQGTQIILEQGFTDNQKKWITNLNKKLKDIKQRVNWLLKEIEKLRDKYVDGDVCLPTDEVIDLIKKAFEGVVDD